MLSFKEKTLSLITILIILIIGVFVFLLYPNLKKIANLKKEINSTEENIERDLMNTKLLKKTIKLLHNIDPELKKINKITIKKGSELELITLFEKKAKQENLNLNLDVQYIDKKPGSKKNKKTTDKFKPYYLFRFKLQGDYLNLIRYLQLLERQEFYLLLDNLHLYKDYDKKSQQEITKIDFEAKIYCQ